MLEGSHRLELIATDAGGARSREERRITVSQVGGVTVREGLEIPESVVTALDRYRAAIEAKDMARLQDVFIGLRLHPREQGDRWSPRYEGLFKSARPIQVGLLVETLPALANGRATLTLMQTMKRGDAVAQPRGYTVSLLKRKNDDLWQITKVE